MKTIFLSLLFLIPTLVSNAQLNENFSDGNFTSNPVWMGNAGDWTVNSSFQLQSNSTVVNGSFYLSTANTLTGPLQWDFYCNLAFNPSGANYADVFLTASAADLSLSSTSGYFVRIGSTNDDIVLYKKDASGTISKLIDGADGILNNSNNFLRIKVTRNASGLWTLSRDMSGTGNSYLTEGTATDNSIAASAFFGILIKQSTASFFQRHYFDDIHIQPYVPDIIPPAIVSVSVISAIAVDVLFDEPVEQMSAQSTANYSVSNGVGTPVSAVRDATNHSLVHLVFSTPLPANINLSLSVNGVKDLAGNTLISGIAQFIYGVPFPYDIVIDEIMADPSPIVQLPGNEWLELKNTSAVPINLQSWKLGKPTGESGPMPSYILSPGAFVTICTGSALAAMTSYGPALAVTNFPSLNNDGDQIYLKSPQGLIIHSVSYTDAWYKNELKKDGGWTLEMIDTDNPCTGSDNWKASTDPRGGTPSAVNSVNAINPDNTPPRLMRATTPDSIHIILVCNEPLDSVSASSPSFYMISDGIGNPVTAAALPVSFDHVLLTLPSPLASNKIYTVTATNVKDCSGNTIGSYKTARVGLPEPADSLDIVVNEILFNPKPNGVDYVECYNRSKKILNLKNAYLANRNAPGIISSVTQFIKEDHLFFPGDYIVVTSDPEIVKRDYVANDPNAFIRVSSTPSFNDDEGDAILLNEQGKIIDEVHYKDDWHFALISNDDGVALERIDPHGPSIQSNFHSAATSIGFGTPTYKNSQYRSDLEVQGTITVTPHIVSPDNDGMDDFATIQYDFPEAGYVANITVFDAVGRHIRYLERNALCGLKGYYRWDGLGEKQEKLPVGIYILYTEVFNLQGKSGKYKNTIVLARRQ